MYSGGVMVVLPLKCYLNDKVVWLRGLGGGVLYYTHLHVYTGNAAPPRLFYTGHVSQHPTKRERAPHVYARVLYDAVTYACARIQTLVYVVYVCFKRVYIYMYIYIYRHVAYTGLSRILFPRFLNQFR